LVAEVSTKEPKTYGKGSNKILFVDCGMKYNQLRYAKNGRGREEGGMRKEEGRRKEEGGRRKVEGRGRREEEVERREGCGIQ
jgi:hypothetical protein